MESKTEMLARHARELAELESRWWEEWFTEDPVASWMSYKGWVSDWLRWLPTIIRKREKIGVTITGTIGNELCLVEWNNARATRIHRNLAEKLAGRTIAPVEKIEI